ncbi:M23 family metallopeptidase [Marnyiella aurantia]|uniref:M23 family metallopeptidase n=1 Tax=Marnyiella aurantia TaxID=2758037 RepID=A0A7D7RKH3_9FLAO|nr:M23 family metallopeptidase [Marnyiella aurantia]MBA5246100.1 M23 family metallopeptidase [Marnyiella aurantia]QMS98512.1 M23 family metallopeptidase [Marnyiella aurantia]
MKNNHSSLAAQYFCPFITRILLAFLILSSITAFAQQKWDIKFYNEVKGREVEIYADNNEHMPMSAMFDFKLNNMISTLANGKSVVIPARTKKFLLAKVKVIKADLGNSFSYTNTYNFGDVTASAHDDNLIYWLPFEKGKTKLIFQGYNGKFSHQNSAALDFSLEEGEKVFTARGGTVVEVEESNNRNCPDISCARFNNYILIMHSDGTFADYSHLKQNGSIVRPGSKVERGQHIGYSGSTGFSNGPHLHFSVFNNRIDGKRSYIKTKFRTSEQDAVLLEEKKRYTKNY